MGPRTAVNFQRSEGHPPRFATEVGAVSSLTFRGMCSASGSNIPCSMTRKGFSSKAVRC